METKQISVGEQAAMNAIDTIMKSLVRVDDRSDALSLMLLLSYQVLRDLKGDQFVIDWMKAAQADMAVNKPFVKMVSPH